MLSADEIIVQDATKYQREQRGANFIMIEESQVLEIIQVDFKTQNRLKIKLYLLPSRI